MCVNECPKIILISEIYWRFVGDTWETAVALRGPIRDWYSFSMAYWSKAQHASNRRHICVYNRHALPRIIIGRHDSSETNKIPSILCLGSFSLYKIGYCTPHISIHENLYVKKNNPKKFNLLKHNQILRFTKTM